MAEANETVTIIGAGVVGTASARMLQRAGYRVRLLDPLGPGQACSWGNAGVFASDSVIPLATPAMLRAAAPMLLRRDAPLSVRWSHLPALLPWLIRFFANARPARVEANARALTELCKAADSATWDLIAGSRAAALVRETGWLTVYETAGGMAAGRAEAAERERRGIPCEVLSAAAIRQRLPEVTAAIVGGLHSPSCPMCTDPAGFVECLADDVVAAGGRLERERVVSLAAAGEAVTVTTTGGRHTPDHLVIAAGLDSAGLARQLGDRFPLDTERGYHLMHPDAGMRPAVPVMAGEHKFVTTAMDAGLRLAGFSELGGPRLAPDPARYDVLLRHARRLFPDLPATGWTPWMGKRSTLPDSLPVIGPSPSHARVYYAFGHQHLGLTLAGLTGRILTAQIAGQTPPVDTTPLRAERW